jgi:hypothetical protein
MAEAADRYRGFETTDLSMPLERRGKNCCDATRRMRRVDITA